MIEKSQTIANLHDLLIKGDCEICAAVWFASIAHAKQQVFILPNSSSLIFFKKG